MHTRYTATEWRGMWQVPGFLVEFITPIVKALKGKQSLSFYTLPEYEAWKESLGGSTKGWQVKYYKGLGTSTAAEAKEYFADLEFHRKGFSWECDGDGDLIEMAFSKKAADKRKTWLRAFTEGTFLDHSVSEVKYSDFINHELILFSRADLQRSIPALMDGFKPGQRKILYAAFKRKLKTDLKVRSPRSPAATGSMHSAELQAEMISFPHRPDLLASQNPLSPATRRLHIFLTEPHPDPLALWRRHKTESAFDRSMYSVRRNGSITPSSGMVCIVPTMQR
jgi:hypothetical protein